MYVGAQHSALNHKQKRTIHWANRHKMSCHGCCVFLLYFMSWKQTTTTNSSKRALEFWNGIVLKKGESYSSYRCMLWDSWSTETAFWPLLSLSNIMSILCARTSNIMYSCSVVHRLSCHGSMFMTLLFVNDSYIPVTDCIVCCIMDAHVHPWRYCIVSYASLTALESVCARTHLNGPLGKQVERHLFLARMLGWCRAFKWKCVIFLL